MPPLARLISLGILTTLIVLLGITFYQVLAPFLLPLFLAWVAAILCRPLYLWVCQRTRGRARLASGMTTAGLLLVVLLPLALGTVFAAAQLIGVATNLLNREDELRQRLTELTSDPRIVQIARWIEPYLVEIPDPTTPAVVVDPAYLHVPGRDPFLDEPPADLPVAPPDARGPGDASTRDETPTDGASRDDTTGNDTATDDPTVEVETSTDAAVDEPTEMTTTSRSTESTKPAGIEPELIPLTPEEVRVAEEAARQRLEARLQASLRATLRYVGGRTIGMVSEVPGVALGVLGQAVSLLVALVMFSIGLYYFLCDGPELLKAAEALIPVRHDYQQELMRRFDQVVRAVVLSTFLSALAQGILTTIALWAADFSHLFVFFVLASLAAMIPLAGTWVVWGPCSVWLVFEGQRAAAADYAGHMQDAYWYWMAAGLLVAFGVLVIGFVDNLIRTYILNTNARLHPLLAFVSVLGGLQVMGLWGVFIAPIVAACLHALIEIFNAELKTFSQERAAVRDGTESDVADSPPPAATAVAAPTSTPQNAPVETPQ